MVVCYQQARHLNEATQKLGALAETGKLRHGNNPVLRWMNGNVQIRSDADGHIKIEKGRSLEKVDGMTSTVMAIKGWIYHKEEEQEDINEFFRNERPDGFLSF